MTKRNRKRHPVWTDEQIAILERMVEARMSPDQIAVALGRTLPSVTQKAAQLGFAVMRAADLPPTIDPYAVVPSILKEWPAEARFDDDPRAPAWEPRWRAPPIVNFSPMGCGTAMCSAGVRGAWA